MGPDAVPSVQLEKARRKSWDVRSLSGLSEIDHQAARDAARGARVGRPVPSGSEGDRGIVVPPRRPSGAPRSRSRQTGFRTLKVAPRPPGHRPSATGAL